MTSKLSGRTIKFADLQKCVQLPILLAQNEFTYKYNVEQQIGKQMFESMTGGMKLSDLLKILGGLFAVTNPDAVFGIEVKNSETGRGVHVEPDGTVHEVGPNPDAKIPLFIPNDKESSVAVVQSKASRTPNAITESLIKDIFNVTNPEDMLKLDLMFYATQGVDANMRMSSVVGPDGSYVPLELTLDGYAISKETAVMNTKWLKGANKLLKATNAELVETCKMVTLERDPELPTKPTDAKRLNNPDKDPKAKSLAVSDYDSTVAGIQKGKYELDYVHYATTLMCPNIKFGELASVPRYTTGFDGKSTPVLDANGKPALFFAIKHTNRFLPGMAIVTLLTWLTENTKLVDRSLPLEFIDIIHGPWQEVSDILHRPMTFIDERFEHTMIEQFTEKVTDLRKALHDLRSGEAFKKRADDVSARLKLKHNVTMAAITQEATFASELTEISAKIEADKLAALRKVAFNKSAVALTHGIALLKMGSQVPGRAFTAIAVGGLSGLFHDMNLLGSIAAFVAVIAGVGSFIFIGPVATTMFPFKVVYAIAGGAMWVFRSPGKLVAIYNKRMAKKELASIPADTPISKLHADGSVEQMGVVGSKPQLLISPAAVAVKPPSPPALARKSSSPPAVAAAVAAAKPPSPLARKSSPKADAAAAERPPSPKSKMTPQEMAIAKREFANEQRKTASQYADGTKLKELHEKRAKTAEDEANKAEDKANSAGGGRTKRRRRANQRKTRKANR